MMPHNEVMFRGQKMQIFPVAEIPKRRPCVYFLLTEGEIVYIGQTTCLSERLRAHLKDKHFDNVLYFLVSEDELDEREKSMIAVHRPILNTASKPWSKTRRRGVRRANK